MKKSALQGIVTLMSLALIGIILMQINWLHKSIQLNEAQFNKGVMSSLSTVSEKLTKHEMVQQVKSFFHTTDQRKVSRYHCDELSKTSSDVHMERQVRTKKVIAFFANSISDTFLVNEKEFITSKSSEYQCSCARCKQKQKDDIIAYFLTNQLNNAPIAETKLADRIDLEFLDASIHEELENQGIKLQFDYGLFSNRLQSFEYITSNSGDEEPSKMNSRITNLAHTHYKVDLFESDEQADPSINLFGGSSAPGLLMIHFPGKSTYLWRSIWVMVLGSILFTGVLLFCFAYTIMVILRQKNLSEMKTDFINNMTHEFKTPIATISLASDSICNPAILSDPEKVSRFAKIIGQENKRMNSQVEKVLQMAMIDKRDLALKINRLNLHDIVHRAAENMRIRIEPKGGEMILDLGAADSIIEGDQTHVSNVINNLLDNANKYTPENPRIELTTSNVQNGIEICVKDNGIGMDDEARKKIFDKFYRVQGGNLHDIKGFGLGLSYVKAIVTAHKGSIRVQSKLGQGTTFTVFLPHFHETNDNL